ncbi:MAG TPA: DUF1579 family protein [Micromonosporaceae bacterium]|nr:DUF1579 family protein [Micromonosporaceae bacterium]
MTTTTDPAATLRRPITPGSEMAALARFYPDVIWTGTIAAGGMGPGTPQMTAHGRGIHELIQDGRWIVGSYSQEQYLPDGTHVLTWQLHWVVGWDPARSEYVATLADCYGHADVMHGHIDGDWLIFETATHAPARLRLTWDATDPQDITWRNEASIDGGPWTEIETYHMTPAPK